MDHISLGSLAVWEHRTATKTPKARALIVHGLSEHSGRHLNLTEFLTQSGYDVIRFDLRGAGKSGGRRQWINRFEDYIEDVANVHSWILREKNPLPLFLYGHSLGGAISVHFAANYDNALTGLILSAPAFYIGDGVSPLKIALGKMLSNFTPTLRVPGSLEKNTISRDPAVEEAYRSDPLCSHFNTVRQGTEILRALKEIPARARRIKAPLFMVHGTHDRIIRLEGTYELLRTVQSPSKEMLVMPSSLHEVHNDLDRHQAFQAIERWMTKRIHARD